MKKMTKFEKLGLEKKLLNVLDDAGFVIPFPIQERAIPVLLESNDVIGQAHTGTGKTAAYALPMIQLIVPNQGIQGIIMAPTRELALQITSEIKRFAKNTGTKTATIYGGQGMGIQLDALRKKPEIIVATPGRLIDHLKRGTIKLNNIRHVVLDEADVMLDMGFIDDITFILDLTPEEKTTSLWSATMPPEIMRLAETNMKSPKRILVDSDDLSGAGIDQSFLVIKDREKSKFLLDFIHGNIGQCIVFCSTKIRTRLVAKSLYKSGESVVSIEGDMSQHRREETMLRFRKAKANILVATDVAARGIDIPQVALVINYDVPNQDMVYFHRIGRTARAGGKGRAITLVSYSSVGEWNEIKKQTKVKMTDLNEKLGIEIKIPDPLKRRESTRQSFHRRGNKSSKASNRYRAARDKYDKRKKKIQPITHSYFSKKKRW
ncbi:DEAD-box ATP-dependent RNA helicase CshA protein [Marine Group I thaumarchaeote SCGC AAA799-O18]|jgi:ATP-dependent RNA helicase DeaD|nr:DEAD-box ATP-dependent RNA helicase CshA protein [Marine Group I thaumarchaeote SCGC AAA799-O18]